MEACNICTYQYGYNLDICIYTEIYDVKISHINNYKMKDFPFNMFE